MTNLPNCPKCNSEYTYEYNNTIFCPDCFYEWVLGGKKVLTEDAIKDSNGSVLNDGDTIVVIKDLKVKGSSLPIKQGTKVKNIKLTRNPSDGHDIDCRIDGFGAMKLKSEFVKKV